MSATPSKDTARSTLWGFDRRLAILLGGAVLLIIAGLVAVPLAARRTPTLAAETTPEGVVQRFYQAVYTNNYSTAYGYIAASTKAKVTVSQLQQSLQYSVDNSQMRTGAVTIDGETATVIANLTTFGGGSLFSSNEWTNEQSILLKREGDTWKLVSGFGVYFDES